MKKYSSASGIHGCPDGVGMNPMNRNVLISWAAMENQKQKFELQKSFDG